MILYVWLSSQLYVKGNAMEEVTRYTTFCMNYSVAHTAMSKKIDNHLSVHGINFSEFMILYHLDQAIGNKMRRIDLAEKIGLSASGITRLVTPMEKIGLVHKVANKRDARVSLVKLAAAGQRILQESTISLNVTSQEMLSNIKADRIDEMLNVFSHLSGKV